VDKHALCAWHRSGAARDIRKLRRLIRWERAAARAADWNARAEVSELALVETICDELRGIVDTFVALQLWRASLFICKQDNFVLAGRYSPMAQYSRSVGRGTYPLGSGILGQAWNDGEPPLQSFQIQAQSTTTTPDLATSASEIRH